MSLFSAFDKKLTLPSADEALPGRDRKVTVPAKHFVLGTPMTPEYPETTLRAIFGMGCFWGAERVFWEQPGVFTTAVGYAGGITPNPSYEEVCSGLTGHTEAVLVVYHPHQIDYPQLLKLFWENHNPTQGMRQANDRGTQYRSAIYWTTLEQKEQAEASLATYQSQLDGTARDKITTEMASLEEFYFAEGYHQQYLAKNPGGYCNLQTLAKSGLPPLP